MGMDLRRLSTIILDSSRDMADCIINGHIDEDSGSTVKLEDSLHMLCGNLALSVTEITVFRGLRNLKIGLKSRARGVTS